MAKHRLLPGFVVGFLFLSGLFCLAAAQTMEEDPSARILVVYSGTSSLPANIRVTTGLTEVLESELSSRIELYTEFRAIEQFPDEEQDRSFADMLVRKYSERPLDVVVALGPEALRLVMAHRAAFAPGASVIAGGITQRSMGDGLPPDVHGAVSSFDVGETVALARRLQPDARRLVVFTGSSDFDRNWETAARAAFEDERLLEVDFVSGLTIDEFETAASALGARTILLILTIFEDASGTVFIPAEAAELVAARSGAPTWSVYSTFVENGVTGGVVESFEEVGRTIGRLALDALSGDLAPSTFVAVPHASVLDWSQLRRFNLDPGLLPPDAVLLNYAPSAWERYWSTILVVCVVVFAQAATIAALIVQGRRRQAAQRDAAEHRLELARMSRVSQIGALSGAITHELNQPLTAILANAEAGARLLRDPAPDLTEVGEILGDIAEDDRRAAKIISDLRSLMNRRVTDHKPVDLNEVAKVVAGLVQSEALIRGVQISVRLAPRPLVVLGDVEQFKQVVLNLMLNGMDAMAEQPPSTRFLSVTTAERPDGWRVIAVQDSGPGLSDEVADDPFQPFLTTKAKGIGMGLAICRTIVEAHDGTIGFEPCGKGARAVLALPPERRG